MGDDNTHSLQIILLNGRNLNFLKGLILQRYTKDNLYFTINKLPIIYLIEIDDKDYVSVALRSTKMKDLRILLHCVRNVIQSYCAIGVLQSENETAHTLSKVLRMPRSA